MLQVLASAGNLKDFKYFFFLCFSKLSTMNIFSFSSQKNLNNEYMQFKL
jgi:hypothetical protein